MNVIVLDEFNDCLLKYSMDNGFDLYFGQSCLHNDLYTESIEFSVYSNKKPIKDNLIILFNQIGFDLLSHNVKFYDKTDILLDAFKFDITKDEIYELMAILKLKGY